MSKYFSESSKSVSKLFDEIEKMMARQELVILVVDEIESLCIRRELTTSGNENLEAMRVVNTVLTRIDCLSGNDNCLILATTNLLNSVDSALIDRADFVIEIPLPSDQVREYMLQDCLLELVSQRNSAQAINRFSASEGSYCSGAVFNGVEI
eukprot:Gregarina_sp_Poly_1__4599@NODE_2464_length_2093_cov_27_441264_g1559_i0_p1_GENE_NODE_2464_length_2093_cov_27_441264_g1559_i0NODE_2464_length_2093_cov_27_441264_g1559_i0_p1_ORF_typecomplete_len152_score22_31AAA/PF00004_29/1_3e14Rad51/PF08423_11/0_00025AAA_22/PF13401_6/0_028AAA_2/PF07724_14/0_06TniB/PF05621_11/0_14CobA_CobO_BtuR/PF02572_15/0_44_NODE_2464_length_2093_cov_27_441264_g1559_i09481403